MQSFTTRAIRFAALGAATLLAVPADAQMSVFKHFKRYPASGQWQQELTGYRDGKSLGPPQTSTHCAGPVDPKSMPAIADFAKGAAPTCTTKVLTDQELLAESEMVCKTGPRVQTIRMQLRAIDDRSFSSETRSSIQGLPETLMKSKVTFLGPCSAEAAAAESKPSAEDCAGLAQARRDFDAAGGAAQCAQVPPQYRAQCEAGTRMLAASEQRCK